MMNLATILSIKNWPIAAEFGFSSLFFILLAILFFFIPAALVSAELATGWPQQGGIFVWVKEALGPRFGFMAVWLLWVENVAWYPTILSFISATLAYSIDPKLSENPLYMFTMVISLFWGATYFNLRGIKVTSLISTIGVLLGTLFPGLLIIALGVCWIYFGHPLQIEMTMESFIPQLSHPYELVFLAGIILSFSGIEMNAIHAKDVNNPQRSYPLAILYSSLLIVFFTILGTLAIAIVIPQKEISLVSGSISAISAFLTAYQLDHYIPFVSILVAFGALAGMVTWTAGPCRGILTAAESGDLPPILHRVNQHDMPISMMLLQAGIVTVLALLFLLMPNVSSSFWILTAMASQLYLLMYLLLFISALVLRYKRRDVHRTFKVPFGQLGMWLICLLGIISSLFCIIFGFFPPIQIDSGHIIFYVSIQVLGMIAFCIAPYIILLFKQPSWIKH